MPFPSPELFSLDGGVVYMDSASVTPIPRTVEEVALRSASSKAQPWRRDRDAAQAVVADLRKRAAALVNAEPGSMAVTCAVSYGLAVARTNLPVRVGERILVLQDDHTSQALTWQAHALSNGAELDVVPRPLDGNWTDAILSHLSRPDTRRIAIASLCDTFWVDGSRIELPIVCAALRALDTAIVLDLTQSVGVLEVDVRALQADFVVFPMYKWLLGPYGIALLYVASRWHDGTPLEQNGFNRDALGSYVDGAARFDMGQRDTFVSIPTSLSALNLGTTWSRAAVREHLATLTSRIASRVSAAGFSCLPEAHRSPHILGVQGVPDGVAATCRTQGIVFTQRHGSVRISPHIFNSTADADRCADVLISAARAAL